MDITPDLPPFEDVAWVFDDQPRVNPPYRIMPVPAQPRRPNQCVYKSHRKRKRPCGCRQALIPPPIWRPLAAQRAKQLNRTALDAIFITIIRSNSHSCGERSAKYVEEYLDCRNDGEDEVTSYSIVTQKMADAHPGKLKDGAVFKV